MNARDGLCTNTLGATPVETGVRAPVRRPWVPARSARASVRAWTWWPWWPCGRRRLLLTLAIGAAVAAPLAIPLATPLAAQSSPVLPDTLTLDAALRLAGEYSPALARVDAQRGIDQGANRVAGQWPNPTLEYRRENLGAPLQPDEFFTAYIPIDVTGRRIQLSRATSRGRARADAQRLDAERAVQLSIASAWVEASLATSVRQTRRRQAEAVQEIARLEQLRAREGAGSEASALRTQIEAARLLQDVALDEAREQSARVILATLVGVSASVLPPLPTLDASRELVVRRSAAAGEARATAGELSEAALVTQARQARSALRAAELARDEAELRARVARGGVLGDWELQAGTKRTSGFMSGQVGLAVPLPLFNRNSGARLASASTLRDAEAAYRALDLQIEGEVIAAADNVRRLLALQSELLASPAYGDVIVASARVAYAEGEMSLLELLDAHRAWADAYLSAQQYHANLMLAQLRLQRAIGAPIASGATP